MENNQPLVSVIMNCYNSDKYLREAIDSVLEQTYQNWEIIFWDNQSTDRSAEIVKSYDDERIKYFYAHEHTLLGEARNLALSKVNGEYIAFLDCDDIWIKNKLILQVNLMKSNDKVGLCHCNYKMLNTKTNISSIAHKRLLESGNVANNITINYNNWMLGMSCIMISKQVLDDFREDLFDSNLKLVEEYEFFCRVLKKYELAYCPNILTIFKWHGHNNSIQFKNNWSSEYMYMSKKYLGYDFTDKEIEYLRNTSVFYEIKFLLFDDLYCDAKKSIKVLKINSFKYLFVFLLLKLPINFIKVLKPFWKRGAYAN